MVFLKEWLTQESVLKLFFNECEIFGIWVQGLGSAVGDSRGQGTGRPQKVGFPAELRQIAADFTFLRAVGLPKRAVDGKRHSPSANRLVQERFF
jgi:hypothetical protein